MDKTTPKTKVCSKCAKRKPLKSYTPHALCRLGVRPECKACCAFLRRKERSTPAGREKHLREVLKYQKLHRDKANKRNSIYKKRHPIKAREHASNSTKKLSDSYVAQTLRTPVDQLPDVLIQAKRLHLQITRYLKNGN